MGSLTSVGYVVFSKQTDVWWLRGLGCGYKHCFVLLNDGEGWMSLDPMLHCMEMKAHRHISVDFDLPGWLEKRGMAVVPAALNRGRKHPAQLSFLSCVSVVKRIFGIHDISILTPNQLYRYLIKKNE